MAQALLDFPALPADDALAFELGRDFAHYALTPPTAHLAFAPPLRQGWSAGRATFGPRTLAPTPQVHRWLQLRLHAWRAGRAFEGVLVTPNYLRQIDVDRCPITRQALTHGGGQASDGSVDRVRDDAGYAAGNLAVMSALANRAKGRCGFDDALAQMRLAEACASPAAGEAPQPGLGGLDAAAWARVAVLCSFVTALPHEQAAGLPMLLLPPNRLRLFNPIQALQALVTRQFGFADLSARVARVEALLPGKPLQRDFRFFVNALLPRVLERGRRIDAQATRWALEDAWRDPLLLRCWSRFARQLTAAQAERIVLRTSAAALDGHTALAFTPVAVTEGWELEHGGYSNGPARGARVQRDTSHRTPQSFAPGSVSTIPGRTARHRSPVQQSCTG